MGFQLESELQELIHRDPTLVQKGIPDISPEYNDDVAKWVSLGREIKLGNGNADNLYVDANGIVTIVECKLYGNGDLKRKAYAQANEYASSLSAAMASYEGEGFYEKFFDIIQCGETDSRDWNSFDDIVDELKNDEILKDINQDEWEREFKTRLRLNTVRGIFRIIILAGQKSGKAFPGYHVRNLMKLMSYSEQNNPSRDVLVMDLRALVSSHEGGDSTDHQEKEKSYQGRIIWRNHAPLPKTPKMQSRERDTSVGIEKMNEERTRVEEANEALQQRLHCFLERLRDNGYEIRDNTTGLAIYRDSSQYITVVFEAENERWGLRRHQIWHKSEPELYAECKSGVVEERLTDNFDWEGDVEIEEGATSRDDGGVLYHIHLYPDAEQEFDLSIISDYLTREFG